MLAVPRAAAYGPITLMTLIQQAVVCLQRCTDFTALNGKLGGDTSQATKANSCVVLMGALLEQKISIFALDIQRDLRLGMNT